MRSGRGRGACLVLVALGLAACGGTGGGTAPADAAFEPPADAALGPPPVDLAGDRPAPGMDAGAAADLDTDVAAVTDVAPDSAGDLAADAAGAEAAVPDLGPDLPAAAGEAVAIESSCAQPPIAMPPLVQLAFDVKYASPGGQDQLLDVAWPAGAGLHPVVVLIHGGGWVSGDKMQHRQAIHRLAGLGYVGVSINHRLATTAETKFPAAPQDVRCALRWLRAQAATYAIDPARAALMGTSAGAHLAALAATAPGSTFDRADCAAAAPVEVRAVIAYYGVYDLRLLALLPGGQVATFLGTSDPAVASQASPVVHIDAADPPFLLVHGTADNTAPSQFSQGMKSALQAGGVPATFVELAGAPHGFDVFDATWPASTCTALSFLRARLMP